ncbi:hypothetical protein GP486_001105 [Trichoglossum hirsutum]|uniref:Uncharacterized protein n=1 Tax=Trichoglossum hirsutum TaxID=265104 RepID=A0A9P8LHH0_9PEZI|nr:hypothetical protein GP486_001105 [Trichoglossum hirsutum]
MAGQEPSSTPQQPLWDLLLSRAADGSSSYLLILRQQYDEECLRTKGESSIPVAVIGERIGHLSSALIQLENKDTPFQKELQFRALISALALAKYNDVHSFSAPFSDELYGNIANRFRELVLQPQPQTDVENVRKANSSYLIRFALEHVKLFGRAEPVIVSILPYIFQTLLGAAVLTSGQLNGVEQVCQGIEGLSRFWRDPQPRHQVLLGLQDLTRAAVAINFKAKYTKDDRLWAFSIKMAKRTLRELLNTLGNASGLEATPPLSVAQGYWEKLLAILNRGSPGLNKYFYFFGLLDCAAQLGRILDSDDLPSEMKLGMKKLFLESNVPQLRWKAIEILLSFTAERDKEYKWLGDQLSTLSLGIDYKTQLLKEIDVIRLCLIEEESLRANSGLKNAWRPQKSPRGNSRALDSMSTSPSSSLEYLVMSSTSPLPSGDWTEKFQTQDMLWSRRFEKAIQLPAEKHFGRPKKYTSAGLSSDCTHAFLLSTKSLFIYSLPDENDSIIGRIITKTFEAGPNGNNPVAPMEVVLSQRFLATIASEELMVYEYRSGDQLREISYNRFERSCLRGVALHEGVAFYDFMVLVGRQGRLEGRPKGHVELLGYRADDDDSTRRLDSIYTFDLAAGDSPKMLSFGLGGTAFVCATAVLNYVLVWRMTDELLSSRPDPYKVPRNLTEVSKTDGITSISLFTSPSGKSYVFYTTLSQQYTNGGERSFISPIFLPSESTQLDLIHSPEPLNHRLGLIAGTALSRISVIAVTERTGKIMLLPLSPHEGGGINTDTYRPCMPSKLDNSLCAERGPSMNCLRFNPAGTHLYAIDVRGKVIITKFAWPPLETS